MLSPSQQFDIQFKQKFQKIGAKVLSEYKPIFNVYQRKHIFKASTLQKDKRQLLKKVDHLTSQNQRLQYTMQRQSQKIYELQRLIDSLQNKNKDQLSVIQGLQIISKDLQESLNMKIEIIRQVQQDKDKVIKQYEQRNNQYNLLCATYIRQKNLIIEKLNSINELQKNLFEKQNQMKSERFMLQKAWEQIQQWKKQNQNFKKSRKKTEIDQTSNSKHSINKVQTLKEEKLSQSQNKKSQKNQILKAPLKKIYKHHNSLIHDMSFNYNGNLIATCGGDRQIKLFDVSNLKSGITITSNSVQSIFISVSLNYGGQRLLTGDTEKTVQIFHSQTGKQLHTFLGHGDKVNSVAWSSSKQKCISGGQDRQIKIWQIQKSANLFSIHSGKCVRVISSNPVQPIVYSGHSDGSVRIYSINQGTQPIVKVQGIIDYQINSLSLTSNRYQILVSSYQGTTIHLLDLKMNKSLAKYENKQFFNNQVKADLSPSQGYIVAGNCDGQIYYWDRDKKTVEKKVTGHDGRVTSLKYHNVSCTLASADNSGNLIIWQ